MDNLTPEQRKKNMRRIRSENTNPERLLAAGLRKRKVKFIRHDKTLPGKPDIVIREGKTAVFVDSDFWHGNPKRFIKPKTNTDYWKRKIADNRRRDRRVSRLLKKDGWNVVRIWEYEIKHNMESCIRRIIRKSKE